MGTGGWGAWRDQLCTGQRGFSINLQVWSRHAARVSGVGRLVSCKTLANPGFQPLPRSCWSLGGRGRPWVAQSGCEPRPRCQQRVHAAHGSVRLTAALLNYPEDVTKGKFFSAPLAALELGCPLLPVGRSWSSSPGSTAPNSVGCDGSPGDAVLRRAFATVKSNSKPLVVHQVLSTEFPPGSLRGCWGWQGAFRTGKGWEDAGGGSAKRPGAEVGASMSQLPAEHSHCAKTACVSTPSLSRPCCLWALDEERI